MAYDEKLAGAVARFQASHGIVVDSVLGPGTVEALNIRAEYRLGQIAANLERYRWLPRTLGSRYILVNVPAFRFEGLRFFCCPLAFADFFVRIIVSDNRLSFPG